MAAPAIAYLPPSSDIFFIFDLVEDEDESSTTKSQASKETINFKEVKRIDHILTSLHRKVTVKYPLSEIFKVLEEGLTHVMVTFELGIQE